ncbi:glycosyl hydrolase [Streptacidiphilus pinicola]|uniref:Glycosyl hydrolase n=1 Tax=Streptacidiphilus pinicola TaxID=2219663 RepID=A0A2X0K0N9_9ACTN|nr:glycoside hydrolase family 76 protein [Streptacidiphilus pinicola]RAG81089.1 glycosyl hydrolase [Streptacidiphilus pinicola]
MRFAPLRLALAGALLVLATAGTAAAATPHPTGKSNAKSRAVSAYRALETYLATTDGSGLYREQYPVAPTDNAYSYEWSFSQAHVATLDLATVDPGYGPALARHAAAQEHYWKPSGGATGLPGYASYPVAPYGGGGDFFYDDNEWVGLLKVQSYLSRGGASSLARAEQIFALTESGWDTDPTHADPGGVFWTQATWSHDRNTVSTMPGAELGLRLYQITHKAAYLQWALRMYAWTNAHLQSPSGLYWDHLDLQGTVEPTMWSYNQGVPVGVNVLLYQVTHDSRYLREAKRIADAAYTYYVTGDRLFAQPIFFNSIMFKNLLLLESVTGENRYDKAMSAYADRVWTTVRNPATGLVQFDSGGTTQLLQQSAFVQIYAALAMHRSDWSRLY